MVLPLSCLSLYDRMAALPAPLDQHRFPLLARFYIRKALLTAGDLEGLAKDLDAALGAVLASGLGAASPQATSLVIYLSKRYLEDEKTKPERLEEALAALMHKPHVGEGLAEEQARLEMGLQVLRRLHRVYQGDERANDLVQRYEAVIKRCPPPLSQRLQSRLKTYIR